MSRNSLRPFFDGDLSVNNFMVLIDHESEVLEQPLDESNGVRRRSLLWW